MGRVSWSGLGPGRWRSNVEFSKKKKICLCVCVQGTSIRRSSICMYVETHIGRDRGGPQL